MLDISLYLCIYCIGSTVNWCLIYSVQYSIYKHHWVSGPDATLGKKIYVSTNFDKFDLLKSKICSLIKINELIKQKNVHF